MPEKIMISNWTKRSRVSAAALHTLQLYDPHAPVLDLQSSNPFSRSLSSLHCELKSLLLAALEAGVLINTGTFWPTCIIRIVGPDQHPGLLANRSRLQQFQLPSQGGFAPTC